MSLTTDCDIDRVERVIADAVSVRIAPISFDLPDILADGLHQFVCERNADWYRLANSTDCDGACSTWVAHLGRSQVYRTIYDEGEAVHGFRGDDSGQHTSVWRAATDLLRVVLAVTRCCQATAMSIAEVDELTPDGGNIKPAPTAHLRGVKAVAASPEDVTPDSNALGSSFTFGEQQDPSAAEPALTSDPMLVSQSFTFGQEKGKGKGTLGAYCVNNEAAPSKVQKVV
ncbi:hypothetical protein C8J55DRAFT_567122 [Lentinula edodes]|uniref:Uncharacterized protein n=1 Tax=Lentinula lateritia TaxID=40482 RepID=A0A9W8ZQ70_9AGAR|nr:hypothetical protein C8J55DRAFT_567122 [Lentinula edodes]